MVGNFRGCAPANGRQQDQRQYAPIAEPSGDAELWQSRSHFVSVAHVVTCDHPQINNLRYPSPWSGVASLSFAARRATPRSTHS
jgi:hypothetical protein